MIKLNSSSASYTYEQCIEIRSPILCIQVKVYNNLYANKSFKWLFKRKISLVVYVFVEIFLYDMKNAPYLQIGTGPFIFFRSIFQVSAVDDDLEGDIVYDLIGVFPIQSFIDVDPSTGVVTLQKSLLSDSVQNSEYIVSMTWQCCPVSDHHSEILHIA